jgi:hypothetical protein
MNNETFYTLIVAVLSSSLLAAAFTSLATGLFSVYLKRTEYENDYYKEIVKRRLAAYEFIEAQIAMLKTSGFDNGDNRLYHIVFAMGMDEFSRYQQNLMLAISRSVWVSERTTNLLVELGRLLIAVGLDDESDEGIKEVGKQRYQDIATMRHRLEVSFRDDFLEIHKVKKFLQEKKHGPGFELVDLKSGKTMSDQ